MLAPAMLATRSSRMSQDDLAARLRVPCDHAHVTQERGIRGSGTGDYICDACGESGHGGGWPERERADRAQRIETALVTLKREQIQATRNVIELRRDQHVQRMLAALKAGDRDEATKAAGSRDAC